MRLLDTVRNRIAAPIVAEHTNAVRAMLADHEEQVKALQFGFQETADKQEERHQKMVNAMQFSVSALQNQRTAERLSYSGNNYPSYAQQVVELDAKYQSISDWGNFQVGLILLFRAFFTLGGGVEVRTAPGFTPAQSKRTIDFINEFIKANQLKSAYQRWAIEAEIEGKFLTRFEAKGDTYLPGDPSAGSVRALYLPWRRYKYDVLVPPGDYRNYTTARYYPAGAAASANNISTLAGADRKTLGRDEFVYQRWGGVEHEVNDTMPLLGRALSKIESLDKALFDWRKINRVGADPTPHLDFEDPTQAEKFVADHTTANNELIWTYGNMLVTSGGTFKIVGAPAEGVKSLEDEIMTLARFISGATGIPVHFLGLPGELSNRATAESLLEQVLSSVSLSRDCWGDFYTNLFQGAAATAKGKLQNAGDLNPMSVEAKVLELSSVEMGRLTSLYIPLLDAAVLSQETLREKVPGIDAKQEKERVDAEAVDIMRDLMKAPGVGEEGGSDE